MQAPAISCMQCVLLASHLCFDPFTPKSDQYQIFPADSPEILSHSMENLAFHSSIRWKMIILPILTMSLIHFSYKRLGECTLWTYGSARVNPFRSRVQEVHCPTSYWEMGKVGCIVRICSVITLCQWVSYEQPSCPHRVMLFFWWGCRRNLKLITLGSETVNSLKCFLEYHGEDLHVTCLALFPGIRWPTFT